MGLGLPRRIRERRPAYLLSGQSTFQEEPFHVQYLSPAHFLTKKKKICPPIQIHFMSPVPAHCGHILHRATLIVSGPVIASEWCALIACKLLQHQFVWLSLEGATGLRALCETGKDWSPREVLSASFPSISLDLILDESIQRSQEGCPLRKRSVFTPLICKSSDGQKPPASLARSLRWFYQFLQKEI